MKHLILWENYGKTNIWETAYNNTVSKKYFYDGGVRYLRTCKTCDDIVNHKRTQERQLLGNVYQTVSICQECNNPFIIDENQNYEWFLKAKDDIKSEHEKLSKKSFSILITKEEMKNKLPSNKIDDFFVYTEVNEDKYYTMSHTFNNHYQETDSYVVVLEYPSMEWYSSTPWKKYWTEPAINVLKEVINGLKKYNSNLDVDRMLK